MVTLQIAQPQHFSVLTGITLAAKRHWNYPEKWIQIWLPMLTISPLYIQQNETWMAIADEEPVAYYSLKQENGSLWLDNLWVLPEFMGQGIGKRLFEHALERSRVYEVAILKIEADPNAQSFYEKMGARKVGEHQSEVDGQLRILPVMQVDLK